MTKLESISHAVTQFRFTAEIIGDQIVVKNHKGFVAARIGAGNRVEQIYCGSKNLCGALARNAIVTALSSLPKQFPPRPSADILARYGRHDNTCPLRGDGPILPGDPRCDCGLSAAAALEYEKSVRNLIPGVECAKGHGGSHALYRVCNWAECAGCLEYYSMAEVAAAQPVKTMMARGVRAVCRS